MFQLDIFGNLSPLGIYLVKPNNEILGSLDNIIDETSSSLYVGLNKQYSISFDIRHISGDRDWFDYVQEGMYLFVEGFGLFKIDNPSSTFDGIKEQKSVTAHGCDSELENNTCMLDINMGQKTSMEYLVEYDDEETENVVNPYTGVPYDWIVLYNTFPEQLAVEAEKLSDGYYGDPDTSGDIIVTDSLLIDELTSLFSLIPRLKNKILYTDNTDGSKDSTLIEYVIVEKDPNDSEIILSYTLTSLYSSRINSLITFYEKYRDQLSLLQIVLENTGGAWTVGDIYGIDDGDYTLANTKCQFEINETIYSFLTQKLSAATNSIVSFDIVNRQVNLTPVDSVGEYTGIFMGYDTLVNSLNIETQEDRLATRLLVSGGDGLDITRVNFGSNYVDDLSYKMNVKVNGERIYVNDVIAQKYNDYVEYRETQRERYIQLSKEYEEYSNKISEIENRLPNDYLFVDWSTYTLTELQTMLTNYKNLLVSLKSLYKEEYGNAGLNIDESINEDFIKNTPYWWDYTSYKSVISQLECAIDVFPYYDDQSQWTTSQINEYKDAISSWETEWSLYGIVELRAKIETYKQNMDLLAQESVVRVSDDSYVIKTWAQLTDSEKAEYGESSELYRYDTYMEYYTNMIYAQQYLDSLVLQEDSLLLAQEQVNEERVSIVNNVSLESFFTGDECEIIYKMLRDSSYSNENIFSTSIDSTSESIDAMYELLSDAQEHVSITSRPQLTFSVEADNLLANPDLIPFWSSFVPGNYMLIEYKDGTYVKLRMTGYSFNPCLPSSNDLKIEFSNYIRSKSDYNDWASLLGAQSGVGGSSGAQSASYSSQSYSGDGYGDDIDVTISNTMLSKLLNTELFGTRVTDVLLDTIDANTLTAKTAKFGGLADGTTTINGKCVQTGYIVDVSYNGVNGSINNTAGSVLNLETGLFNFGGGAVKYDGTSLTVDGNIIASTLSAGGKTSSSSGSNGLFIDSSGNLYAGNSNQVVIYSNGTFNFGNNGIVYNGSALTVDGNIVADTLSTGGRTSSSTGSNGLYIDSNGNLYAGSNNQIILYANGTFNFGNGSLVYDGTNLTINASALTVGNNPVATTSDITSEIGKYIRFESQYGLMIADMTSGSQSISGATSFNTLLTPSALKIRNGTDTLAEYGQSIKLYNPGTTTAAITISPSSATFNGAVNATSLSTGSKTSSSSSSNGLFIDSSGNLYAGNTNQTQIKADGTLRLANGALQYNGSKLIISGDVDAETFTAYGSNVVIGDTTMPGTYVTIGDNITLTNRTSGGISASTGYICIRETGTSSNRATYFRVDEINFAGIGTITASGTSTSFSATRFLLTNSYDTGLTLPAVGTYLPYAIRLYNGTLYFGTNPDPDAASSGISRNPAPITYVRGETVRITGHTSNAGGVFLGTSTNSNVYLVNTSTAVTSDEEIKNLYDLGDKYITFFNNITPIGYKYKNNGHRMHIGFGARAVENALNKADLTTEDFAGIVIDNNIDLGDDDNPDLHDEMYFLRYEEFIALNTMMIKRLQSEVEGLKKELSELRHS